MQYELGASEMTTAVMIKVRYVLIAFGCILFLQSASFAQVQSTKPSLTQVQFPAVAPAQRLSTPIASQSSDARSIPADEDKRLELTRKLEQRQMQLRRKEQRELIRTRREE